MDVIVQLLNDFGVTWPKFGAQVFLFIIVYAVLRKFAFAPVVDMFETRRRLIEEGQANAERIKKKLAESEVRCQEILRKANADAQRIIEEGRLSSDAHTQKELQKVIKDAEGIIAKAHEAVEIDRTKMISEVRKEMIHLVVDTTSKVTGRILTTADQERLASETAKELAA